MDDDHYIANIYNAHIDTTKFKNDIRVEINKNPNIYDEELVKLIYDKAIAIYTAPVEPSDDTLICRYYTPAKFIKFLDSSKVAFPTAPRFSDKWECAIPEDYNNAVLEILNEFKRSGKAWEKHVRSKAATWNISCWTELHNHFDDHLMWQAYAGGSDGIGITIRYGQLKSHLQASLKNIALHGQLECGKVNYQNQTISLLPFNKHPAFRNEQEIRFAFRSDNTKLELISVENIFSLFGVRISPAAEPEYAEMIRRVWLRHGGEDRIQHPGWS